MDDVQFGAQLRSVRLERGLTQQELAELAGCGAAKHISKYERGEKDPRVATVRKLATALEVEAAELLEEPERWA